MKKCPECGNQYRPDVDVCPNDGTPLGGGPPRPAPPPADGPPPGSGPPKPAGPPRNESKPSKNARRSSGGSSGYSDISQPGGLTEKSSIGSWIFALLACLLMFGGFYWARGHLLGAGGSSEPEAVEDGDGDDDTSKRKRTRKRRARNSERRRSRAEDGRSYDDYDWTQDFEVDDTPLGDVLSEREPPPEYETVEVREPEPYDPKPDEYQPDGTYRPVARYAEPGADDQVVQIDLGGGGSGPLKPSQVEPVLSVRKLAPCYDPWVSKIPQMRGRVWMDFVVAPDGHVSKVEVTRSELRSRVVEKCLVRRARRFRFPASDGRSTRFDTHFDFTNR